MSNPERDIPNKESVIKRLNAAMADVRRKVEGMQVEELENLQYLLKTDIEELVDFTIKVKKAEFTYVVATLKARKSKKIIEDWNPHDMDGAGRHISANRQAGKDKPKTKKPKVPKELRGLMKMGMTLEQAKAHHAKMVALAQSQQNKNSE